MAQSSSDSSQGQILDELANLISPEDADGCWTIEFSDRSLLPAGLGFELVFHPKASFSELDAPRWAAILCRQDHEAPAANWMRSFMAMAVLTKIPDDISRIAMLIYDERLVVCTTPQELAAEKLASANIPILFDEAQLHYYSCDDLFNGHDKRCDRFVSGDSHLVYDPLPEYAARFSQRQLCQSIARHLCAILAYTGEKPYRIFNESLGLANKTLKALSFGTLELPSESLTLDMEEETPSELAFLCCPDGPDTPAGRLAELTRMSEELFAAWNALLGSCGLNLLCGIAGDKGILSENACEIASRTNGFADAVKAYCLRPTPENTFKMDEICGQFNWERDAIFLADEDADVFTHSEETLSDMRSFLVPLAETSLDGHRLHYNIQSEGLTHAVSMLMAAAGDDGASGTGTPPAFDGGAVAVRDGYNAIDIRFGDIGSFAAADYLLGDGDWAAMFMDEVKSPLLSPFAYAFAFCATGQVPDGISKLAVLSGGWGFLPEEQLQEISDEMARSGIQVLSDPTGHIAPGAVGQEELESLFEDVAIYSVDDGFAFHHPYLASNVRLKDGYASEIAKPYRHLRAQHRLMSVLPAITSLQKEHLEMQLRRLSCGMSSSDSIDAIAQMPEVKLSDGFPGYAMALGVPSLLCPDDPRMPKEKWERAFDELRDLSFIWRDMASSSEGLKATFFFPLGYPTNALSPIEDAFGISMAVEAYYKGVPLQDILSQKSWSDYERMVFGIA